MFVNRTFVIWGRLFLVSLVVASCGGSPEETAPELDFQGLSTVTRAGQSSFILAWQHPENVQAVRYEVYLQKMTGGEFVSKTAGAVQSEGSTGDAALALNSGTGTSSAKGVFVVLAEDESPLVNGELLKSIEGDLNSYKIESLDTGNYAIAVLAEDDLGRRSFAGQVYLLAVQPVVQFEGLKRATLEKDGVLLEWDPLKTSIRGKDSFYTVFLGASFSKPIAIVKEHRYKFSIADVKEGTTLTFAVRATDPRGQQDVNTVTHSVTIPVDDVPFEGCVKARALGADRVEVHFEWPTHREFRSMVVMREGIEVYRTSNKTETSYLDLELSEGEAYTYRCDAVFGQFTKVGSREIEISTLTSNPPQFEGIEKLEIVSATEAKVYWGVATGVAANTYQVYANPGQQVDWEKGPVKTVKSDVLEATVGDLGDDLTIAFGVRACSAADICDFNEVTLFETTADVGPPQTKGALAVRIENSKALVSAPWEGAHGGIAQRILYVKEGTVSQDLSDYRKVQVINTQNNWEVPVELTYSNLLENITYHFIVRDIDPSGNENKSLKVASITTGDLTAPTFAGLTQVRNQVQGDAGDPETELILDFTAIKPQAIDPSGAHEYIIYTAPEDKDACAEADHTVLKRLPASSFAAGAAEYVVSGLTPRTVYHFCLKAVDEAGNISDTTSSFKRNTLDITAPSFDGLQTIKFDRESGKVQLSWNEVTDTDLDGFKLKLWIGNPDSTAVANVVLPVSKDHKASYEFGRDAFSFASLDQVYALLQACDDAHTLTNGTQNCTTLADDSALSVTLDDIEPPSGFLGVGAATSFTQPAQGSVGVTWIAPSDWTDYAGFKVYAVNSQDESLTFLKDCFCVSQNCLANPKTSCVVDGLSAYREYRFHVKAYDADGNHTTLSVADSSTSVRVNDATSPAFAVALQLTFEEGKSKLAWSAATDDQYVEDEDTTFITYTLYRKQSADFTSLTDPSSDGAHEVIYTGKALAHEDGLNLVSGVTYYYALCAQDMSSNSTCLSSSKSVKVPDLIPPTISAFTSDRVDNDDKTWKLQWTVSDNDTSTSQLVVQVKALYSTSAVASDFSSAASLFINNTGATDTGSAAADLLSGEANVDKYVHYMLIVTDASGNKSYAYLSHFVKNKITIESVVGAESSVAGGTRMILRGSGFHTSSTVKVAGQDCSNLKSYERILVCDTPAGSLGLEDIVVANEDGSSTTKTSAYRYCTPNVDCNNICNNPLSWDTGTDFALTVGRGDLPESPYIICTKDHLSKVRDYENMTNKYFEMHANIDLSDSAPGIGTFYGIFDGKGYAVENLELDQDSSAIGLFNRVAWAGSVKNIGVIEGEVAAKERGGLIVGQLDSSASHPSLSGFYGTGVVRSAGSLYSARSMGGLFGSADRGLMDVVSYVDVEGGTQVGGIVGRGRGPATNLHWGGDLVDGNDFIGGVFGEWIGIADYVGDGISAGAGTVKGRRHYGGAIAGVVRRIDLKNSSAESQVEFGYTVAGVTGVGNSVGGLVGLYDGSSHSQGYNTASGLKFTGKIVDEGGQSVGCMVGAMRAVRLSDSHVMGASLSKGYRTVGGLVGKMYRNGDVASTIADSSSDCVITDASAMVGGIAGEASGGSITKTHFSGSITADSTGGNKVGVGGLIGGQYDGEYATTIEDSTVHAQITARRAVGGLVGSTLLNGQNYGAVTIKGQTSFKGKLLSSGSEDTLAFGGIMGDGTAYAEGVHVDAVIECSKHCGGFFGIARMPNERSGGLANTGAKDSVFTGTITGKERIGGAVGETASSSGTASGGFLFEDNKISFFTLTSTVTHVGGFFGLLNTSDVKAYRNEILNGAVNVNTQGGGFVGVMAYGLSHNVMLRDNFVSATTKGNTRTGGFGGTVTDAIQNNLVVGNTDALVSESNHGGFAGVFNNPNNMSPVGNFFDSDTSAIQTTAVGAPLSTQQAQDKSNFSSYDDTVWEFPDKAYPKLKHPVPE